LTFARLIIRFIKKSKYTIADEPFRSELNAFELSTSLSTTIIELFFFVTCAPSQADLGLEQSDWSLLLDLKRLRRPSCVF
jgi:hypothetical protein